LDDNIEEYNRWRDAVAPADGAIAEVSLLATSSNGLVRHGELAGAFYGHSFVPMARCLPFRYTYRYQSAFNELSLSELRTKQKWPDYEPERRPSEPRIGRCAECDADAECEEALLAGEELRQLAMWARVIVFALYFLSSRSALYS
jgi:hypothetical protein